MTRRPETGGRTDTGIRIIDVTVAAVGLFLSSPVLAIAAIGTKLSSRGPVLYRAERAGLEGRSFTMFKLRSMHVGSAAGGAITGGSRDPRIFPWGRALRRLKVDELPQLLNVLRGDMSLVGPRPEASEIVREHYSDLMWSSLEVRPGATGPGSLDYFADERALPSDPDEVHETYLRALLPRKIALDLVYVRHRTVAYHVELLARTILSVLGLRRPFAGKARWELAQAETYLAQDGSVMP